MGMNLGLGSMARYLADRLLGTKRRHRPPQEPRDVTQDVETLEDRKMLTVYTVTTAVDETNDPSTVSLRDAIALANANPGADEIRFAGNQVGQRVLLTQGELVISDPVTITGLGSFNTVIDGQVQSRVFNVLDSAGDVTFEKLTIAQGRTEDFNGRGAGVISNSNGLLLFKESTVIGNFTTGAYAQGGGIFAYTGNVTLIDSTVSGNGTTGGSAAGGGVSTGTGNLTLINSTVSGNVTTGPNSGGAGIATYTGNIRATNSTIAFNGTLGTNSPGAGIFSGGTGVTKSNTITLNNSIIGNNRSSSGQSIDISKGSGTTSFIANNTLISINAGTGLAPAPLGSPDANGNLLGSFASPIDPQLLPLAPNGGTTRTHALASTSPAIDAGNNTLAILKSNSPLLEDQAGQIRVFHGTVDMGAFELQSVATTPTVSFSVAAQSADEASGIAVLTVKLSAATTKDVTVAFTLTGTATAGSDYSAAAGSVTIPAGATSASVQIVIVDDQSVEGDETIIATLGTPTNATLGDTSSTTLSVVDNDSNSPINITLSANTVVENTKNTAIGNLSATNPNPTGSPTFTIQPGGQGSSFVIVNGQLRSGSAGVDYESLEGGVALVTIRATNPNGTYFDKQFSIRVTDVNEAPSITAGQAFTAVPGSAAGTVVGTVKATDPDKASNFNGLSYRIVGGNTGSIFAINATTGQITVAKPGSVSATGQKITLQVRVSNGTSTTLVATQNVTVQLGSPFTLNVPSTPGTIATSSAGAVALSPGAALTNVAQTANLQTARITVSEVAGASSKDSIFIKAGGTVTLQGSALKVNGVTVGSVSGGTLGTPLTIKFTAGNASVINAVLSRISIITTKITGAQALRTIKFDVTAGTFSSSSTVNANVVSTV